MSVTTTVTFLAGTTSQAVTVQTVEDSTVEASENFEASLSNPVGGVLGPDRTAVVNIADNDGM